MVTMTDIAKRLRGVGFTSLGSADAVSAVVEFIGDSLAAGETVKLQGVGSFFIKRVKATRRRLGDETVEVPAHSKVSFRGSEALRKRVWDIGADTAAGSEAGS